MDHLEDNITIDITPFKGPFKGKGANRRAVQQLTNDLSDLEVNMNRLRDEYGQSFKRNYKHVTDNREYRLDILRARGYPQLWWRVSASGGAWVKLFENDDFKPYLDGLMSATLDLMIDFERRRLAINLQAIWLGHTLEHYKRFVNANQNLDELGLRNRKLIEYG